MSTATIEPPKADGLNVRNGSIDEKTLYMQLPVVFKFRLLEGQHVGYNENYELRQWYKGMVISTRQALQKRFPYKFERVSEFERADEGVAYFKEAGGNHAEMLKEMNRDEDYMRNMGQNFPAAKPVDLSQSLDAYLAKQKAFYEGQDLKGLTELCGEEEIPLPGKPNKSEIVAKLLDKDQRTYIAAHGPSQN